MHNGDPSRDLASLGLDAMEGPKDQMFLDILNVIFDIFHVRTPIKVSPVEHAISDSLNTKAIRNHGRISLWCLQLGAEEVQVSNLRASIVRAPMLGPCA